MRVLSFLVVFLLSNYLQAQVTFHITSVPDNTPEDAQIFVAGSFNDWSPNNQDYTFDETQEGYFKTVSIPSGNISFKFTRGSWESVEGDQNGNFLPDRAASFNAGDTLELSIAGWEDLTMGQSGTALPSVSVISSSFYMPQLDRTRRIWVCLPEDYSMATSKRYRVVYMHDAQNLFDNATSFSGEWGIDEHMRDLFNEGDEGAIIIGIENGPARIDEYCPWVNAQYGGGEGDEYVDFIKNTLKPFIDEEYRTLTDASSTAIAGSSLGGLISLYACAKYPETFGKGGLFSPAYWINLSDLSQWLENQTLPGDLRLYMVGGSSESSTMVSNMQLIKNKLIQSGVEDTNVVVHAIADGAHSEWFWNREFPDAYLWLFQNTAEESVAIPNLNKQTINIYPNPAFTQIELSTDIGEPYVYSILNDTGKVIIHEKENPENNLIDIKGLSQGKYLLIIRTKTNRVFSKPFIKVQN